MRELTNLITVNKPEWVCDEQVVAFLNQLADNVEYYRLVMEHMERVRPTKRQLFNRETGRSWL